VSLTSKQQEQGPLRGSKEITATIQTDTGSDNYLHKFTVDIPNWCGMGDVWAGASHMRDKLPR